MFVSERAVEQQRDERDETRAQAENARGHVLTQLRGRARGDARVRVVRQMPVEQWHRPDENRVEHLRSANKDPLRNSLATLISIESLTQQEHNLNIHRQQEQQRLSW